jgi:hypothetical protein
MSLEHVRVVIDGHGSMWDSYKSNGPLMTVTKDDATDTVRIEFNNVYVCQRRPIEFKLRMLRGRAKWWLRGRYYRAISQRKAKALYVRQASKDREAMVQEVRRQGSQEKEAMRWGRGL